jgi:hypothetical protein
MLGRKYKRIPGFEWIRKDGKQMFHRFPEKELVERWPKLTSKPLKYMGCVTDKSWKQALMEKYPNRKPGHPDELRRKREAMKKRDIPELATKSCANEARRCQDVPLADLSHPRWQGAIAHHRFEHFFMTILGMNK